ncbi:LPXTG cell wall anchor domain-containing protein [Pimelobacter simplex]|uniref:LPXTG cell wall anchor domain-containing protein n=1 Tax=Nocardioides simplex TaxID=2045 RepID=UPI0013758548|nr:LPXTG cell wall anchor domain-containing protein [Pimelobacter simplex]
MVLASTAFAAPALADDVDSDPGTPAVSETPAPAPDPKPAPEPKPAPKPDPKPTSEPDQGGSGSSSDDKPAGKPDKPTGATSTDDAEPATPAAPVEAPKTPTKKAASVATPSAGTLFSAAAAEDEPNEKKVVVCKYVSTPPGVLHHIVIPSVNSLPGFPGTFPWAFADAQISVAIRYANVGEQAHDVSLSECPTQIAKPVVPVTDECGPGNAVYGEIPVGNYTAVRNPDGSITLTADAGYLFFGGTKTVTLPVPVETNTAACPEPAEIAPPDLDVIDECGPGNAHYEPVPASDDYTSVVNQDGSVTLTAVAPATFPGGAATYTYPVPTETNTAACPVNEKKVVVCKYVSTPGGVLDHIIIVSVNTLKDFPDPAVFPWQFPDAQDSVAIRYALDGEQAHDVSDVECPQAITPPEVPVTDDCGPGNAVYGEVPAGHYSVTRNQDGSITLTADAGWTFPGGAPTYSYPVPEDENVACPATITPPDLDVTDPCGPGNAVYGEVPENQGYTVTRNEDGSITLTAVGNTEFPGGAPTYTYPVPAETNTEACPVDGRAVVCSIPMSTQVSARADIPGTILILDIADLIAKGFAGVFPFSYTENGVEYDVIRAAAPGETADQVTGITCGVDDVVVNHPPKTPGEVGGVTTGLPNTGGPAGWLIPAGAAMVLAGAALMLLRRREA